MAPVKRNTNNKAKVPPKNLKTCKQKKTMHA